jgi:hypothetical protein
MVAVEADDVGDLPPRLFRLRAGRSILLMTGMISRLLSTARYAFASVCASTAL